MNNIHEDEVDTFLYDEGDNTDQNGLRKSTTDINASGQYEGQNIYDIDLDSFEEKP
ncbi:hypothetical protein H8356DRAFT_1342058 [Neocallimastix lanati (nom. inval.)]|nr:hypothetical protein H8356DRAFT_1342058 [Neocallimastix sp. JGI-2020a]